MQVWRTIAVTALPTGWRNVYRDDDELMQTPCPAMLLQEYVADTGPTPTSPDVPCKQPYQTRVVFADYDGVNIMPANDASNYVETLPPVPQET
jgi:hypothetical protein